MIIDYVSGVLSYMFNNIYIIVVGYWMGHFLYLVIMDSFLRGVEGIGEPMDAFHWYLLLLFFIFFGYTLYLGHFDCLAWAFCVASLWLWFEGYCIQYGTKDRQREYIKKRFDIYCSMPDDELVVEGLLFRIDKHFSTPLVQFGKNLLKILPLALVGFLGMSYNSITNPDLDVLSKMWELYDGHTDIISALVNLVVLLVICCVINTVEIWSRREILEHCIKVKGLENHLKG